MEVNRDMEVLVLPFGADTAGVRRGARNVTMDGARAVKVSRGDAVPGQFIIGGVLCDALSISVSPSEMVQL